MVCHRYREKVTEFGCFCMRNLMKLAAHRLPFGERLLTAYRVRQERKHLTLLKRKNTAEIFTEYYKTNFWQNPETLSGDGSTSEYTETLRKQLPILFAKLEVATLLDAPCGDYNWFQHVLRPTGLQYTGGDIVGELIERNNQIFSNETTRFVTLDIITDKLPPAQLWMCRDVLFHFSNEDIFKTLSNLVRSDIDYFLTSSHTEVRENEDIPTGWFRLLNLREPPFNFPEPILEINDYVKGFPVRKMGLWTRRAISETLFSTQGHAAQ